MADFILFDEGRTEVTQNGLPGTCYFLLSTKSVDSTTPFATSDTLTGSGSGEITGTGYARQSQTEPTPGAGGVTQFAESVFYTATAVDWPSAVRSVVLTTTANNTGKMICAWNLVPGGAARAMNAAGVTERVTPQFTFATMGTTDLKLTSLEVIGHSYGAGMLAYQAPDGTAEKMVGRWGGESVNFAVGGAVLAWPDSGSAPTTTGDGGWNHAFHCRDSSDFGTRAAYTPGPPLLLWYGINDLARLGPLTGLTPTMSAMRAVICRARCGAVLESTDASVVLGGSWSANTSQFVNSGTGNHSTTSAAATITITVPADFPGGEIVLGFVTPANGDGALVNISVTGATSQSTTHDNRNANAFDYNSNRGATGKATPTVKRLTNLNAGAHSIAITISSLTGSFTFDWWGVTATPTPIIVVAGAQVPASFGAYSTYPYNRKTTTLAAQSTAGAVSSTVTSATGMVIGDTFTFEEGVANTETVRITNIAGTTISHATTTKTHANASAVTAGLQAYDVINDLSPQIAALAAEFDNSVLYWDNNSVTGSGNGLYFEFDQLHPNDWGHALLAEDLRQKVLTAPGLTATRVASMATRTRTSYAVRLYRSTSQSIPNTTPTMVSFDTVRKATPQAALWWNTLFPSRVYFRRAGWYAINFVGRWDFSATGARLLQMFVNGSSYAIASDGRNSNAAWFVNTTLNAIHFFAVGDYVEISAYHEAGGALNLTAEARTSPELTVFRLPGY